MDVKEVTVQNTGGQEYKLTIESTGQLGTPSLALFNTVSKETRRFSMSNKIATARLILAELDGYNPGSSDVAMVIRIIKLLI